MNEFQEDYTGKDRLYDRIEALRGKINTSLFKVLDVVRILGNDVLHGTSPTALTVIYLEGDEGHAEVILGALNRLTNELITGPKADDELYDLVPESAKRADE